MSTTPDLPEVPDSQLSSDDDAAFDELARRAGAALRRPAPEDGVRVIVARQRTRRALKASVVGGVAVATLIGAVVIIASRDDPDSLRPVESSPPTNPATTIPSPTPTALLPVDSLPATLPATTTLAPSTTSTAPPATIATSQTQLFTEVAPDTMVTLPPAPTDAPRWPSAVWSGTEMITWGVTPPGVGGAAFNPQTGTWRMTAPAPIDGRMSPTAVWTGTEMIVWGGNPFGGMAADGAAYNPATDTWRRLPDAPLGPGTPAAVWTGDEVVLMGAYHLGDEPPTDASSDARPTAAAAYNPTTDEWRPLADPPGAPSNAFWTGTSILATSALADADALVRYELSSDTWDIVDVDAPYAELVGVPDGDGVARTVIALPFENGAPVAVLDSEGNTIGSLPGFPDDRGSFGDHLSVAGVWAGEEALFWIHDGDTVFIPADGPFEGWALNPATETWRPLPGNDRIPIQLSNTNEMVVAGDVVLVWEGPDAADDHEGVAYRAPTNATG
jgi:hypothetical protein